METQITYRGIIQQEFEFRTKGNPSYSLRAFARDMGLSPSQMSDILRGRTGLSSKKALEVAAQLGMNEQESQCFQALVEVEHGRSQAIVQKAQDFLKTHAFADRFNGLTEDEFRLISDWHHFALLSAMELDNYDGSLNWLAHELNLSLAQVEDAAKRMLKLDYIDLKDGKFILKDLMLKTSSGVPSAALKKFHKQHIQKSLQAVDEVSLDKRDITCMTMAIDLARLPVAKEMIKNFRRELCQYLEGGEKSHVYNINIQLIPLSSKDNSCLH